jgi:K+-transporting ATPase KdpF subunit
MSAGDAIALVIGVGLLIYLTWTLLYPERL